MSPARSLVALLVGSLVLSCVSAAFAQERAHNTFTGPAGGIHVVHAGSGAPSSARLQLAADVFSSSDYLLPSDTNDYFGATLSLGLTPIEHLEVFASVHTHANANTQDEPELRQVLGDTLLGAKGYASLSRWLSAGGDLRFLLLNGVGDVGPVLAGTGVGVRGLLSADFRELSRGGFPLLARASLDYFFDNSAKLIEGTERARYDALGSDRRTPANEDRHLINRVERFALDINRVDALTLSLGAEVPLELGRGWSLHPIAEWSFALPVNRQDYDCLLVAKNTGTNEPDGCIGTELLSAMHSTATLGARLVPARSQLSFLLGLDVGLLGASRFVRELAPNRPWALLFAVGHAFEPQRASTREVVVEREVVRVAPPGPRIAGLVVDAETGAPIAAARVQYEGHALTAQQTGADGRFVSYELRPGTIPVAVDHPEYEPHVCEVQLVASAEGPASTRPVASVQPGAGAGSSQRDPEQQGDGLQLNPYFYKNAASAQAAETGAAPAITELRCELQAKPRTGELRGQVRDTRGEPIAGARVVLTGPESHTLLSDATGRFRSSSIAAGHYGVRVEAEGFLLGLSTLDVEARATHEPSITLVPKPKTAQVELTAREVRMRSQVFFRSGSADIRERSTGLLTEIADVLARNPQVERVEIQGHTDNVGEPSKNLSLSQARAEAVRDWLVRAGIEPERLSARGYGDTRPLAPNITDRNRARNRRVQLIIESP